MDVMVLFYNVGVKATIHVPVMSPLNTMASGSNKLCLTLAFLCVRAGEHYNLLCTQCGIFVCVMDMIPDFMTHRRVGDRPHHDAKAIRICRECFTKAFTSD